MMQNFNYGERLALVVLTANALGMSPALVEQSEAVMKGLPVSIMMHKNIEVEAIRIQNLLSESDELVKQANAKAIEIATQVQTERITKSKD